jgi:ABC-type branched-subunit amino acid transport system substrate-binding protein
MLRQQYSDPWVWPVATATESTMRVMAKHAYDKGARTFGIVYDNKYRFGLEGADAFKKFVASLPGATVASSSPVEPAQSSYGPEIKKFNDNCNPCDMVALLLEPSTATTWIAGRPNRGKLITSGAQTLFNLRFAKDCGAACQGFLVWTGYTPPIDALASLPGVAQYVDDVRAIDPGVDVNNAFLQGAYLGTSAFIEALKQVGPNLTRDRLRAVLDSMTYRHDLVGSLSWTAQRRNANSSAHAFSLQYASDSFSGFRNEQTGRINDPNLG